MDNKSGSKLVCLLPYAALLQQQQSSKLQSFRAFASKDEAVYISSVRR